MAMGNSSSERGAPRTSGIPQQAMLLAAGYGERMRPLTADRAKPSLPLLNRPLILHALDQLARHGVRRVVVNLHHQPESLRRILEAATPAGMSIAYSEEASILGTAGGIRAALPLLDSESPLLVMNADSLSSADLGALAAAHAAARASFAAAATLAVRPRSSDDAYSSVYLDDLSRLCGIGEIGEKGESTTFIGAHILEPEAISRIPREGISDIVRDVYLPILGEGGRLGAWRNTGWWVEIGTPLLYLKAHLTLLEEPSFLATLPAAAGTLRGGDTASFVGPGCEGLPRARLERSSLGAACWLGGDAVVRGSVLGARARVGRQAHIEDSIVWEGVEIPGGHAVHGSLVLPPAPGTDAIRNLPLR